MRSRMPALLTLAVCPVAPAAAQQAPTPQVEIVVEGRPDPDDPDAANRRGKVFAGSRLPRLSSQNNPHLAMRTSANGLTPDSGMDAFKADVRVQWTTCKAEGAALSRRAACPLAAVQKALDKGEHARARTLALDLAAKHDLTAEDRYVVQVFLYRIAAATPDLVERRRALAAMVDSGFLTVQDEAAAVRMLASAAMRAGDRRDAIARYEDAALLDADDSRSRISAAALLQGFGEAERAKAHVRAAIAAARRTRTAVPQAWLDNAR